MKQILILIFSFFFSGLVLAQKEIVINNLKSRVDTDGNIVDAHDGRIVKYGNRFYWYGTAYGNTSGFSRNSYYQCYSSSDMMNWRREGRLLENPPSGYYYRPHVIYNKKTKKYVLWYNWYPVLWDGKFGVAVSDKPEGPFKIVNTDVKVLNSKYGVGDLALFVDDDDTAYILYNTIEGHKGSIERLSDNYLKSTLENSGYLTEGCEASAMFKRDGKYYFLIDQTCCFCNEGSGVRVHISDKPMSGFQFKGNINRFPGVPAPALTDGMIAPNMYSMIGRRPDNSFSPVQVDFYNECQIEHLQIYQFTGNRSGTYCSDTLSLKRHDDIAVPQFELLTRQNGEWHEIVTETSVERTSMYNIITLKFKAAGLKSFMLKASANYPYNEIFINEINMYGPDNKIIKPEDKVFAYINNIDPAHSTPMIPAQQTFVMPLETTKGIEYIWMGDLWGSASDNVKGHDQQYWGRPLVFDADGNIEPMMWVDEWHTTITD